MDGRPADRLHQPVLVERVVELLGSRRAVVDMTLGAGGHAEALLEAGVERLIGLDRDPAAVEAARDRLGRFGSRVSVEVGRFSEPPALEPGTVDETLVRQSLGLQL